MDFLLTTNVKGVDVYENSNAASADETDLSDGGAGNTLSGT